MKYGTVEVKGLTNVHIMKPFLHCSIIHMVQRSLCFTSSIKIVHLHVLQNMCALCLHHCLKYKSGLSTVTYKIVQPLANCRPVSSNVLSMHIR